VNTQRAASSIPHSTHTAWNLVSLMEAVILTPSLLKTQCCLRLALRMTVNSTFARDGVSEA